MGGVPVREAWRPPLHQYLGCLSHVLPHPHPIWGAQLDPEGRPMTHLMRAVQGPARVSSRRRPRGPMVAMAVVAGGGRGRRVPLLGGRAAVPGCVPCFCRSGGPSPGIFQVS